MPSLASAVSVRAVPATSARRALARARRRGAAALDRGAEHRRDGADGDRHAVVRATCRAEDRSWVGLIVQAGIRGFVDWFRPRRRHRAPATRAAAVFGAAPRALAGVITLQQTVDLVRLASRSSRSNVDELARPRRTRRTSHARRAPLRPRGRLRHRRGLRPGRRGRAAPGTPGSRRSSSTRCCAPRPTRRVLSRASALGWGGRGARWSSVLGAVPGPAPRDRPVRRGTPRRPGRRLDALCAVQGDRLVVVLGGVDDADKAAAARRATTSATGPVVVGPVVDDLAAAPRLGARPRCRRYAPRRAGRTRRARSRADDLLPERALAGDGHARRQLVEEVYLPAAAGQGHADRDARGVLRARRRRSRRPPGRCSCTPTRSATGCARSPSSPASPRPTRGTRSRCRSRCRSAG